MLLRAVGKGVAKVFSKSAEVIFLKTVKCVSNLLPSPADYPAFESFLYGVGYYSRTTFTLYIQISKLNLKISKYKYQIRVNASNKSLTSRDFFNDNIKNQLDMVFKLEIKPSDGNIIIEIVEKKFVSDNIIASLEICVNDIINRDFPRDNKFTLFNKSNIIGDITLSFHQVPYAVNLDSELWHKAVIKLTNQEMDFSEVLRNPTKENKLVIMSIMLEGLVFIQTSGANGWKQGFFKILNDQNFYTWSIWDSKLAFKRSEKAAIAIPLLMIKCVRKESENTFKIIYLSGDIEEEIICKHDYADTWVDASNYYIQMLRRYLEHLPQDIFNKDSDRMSMRVIGSTINQSLKDGNRLPACINEMYSYMNCPQ